MTRATASEELARAISFMEAIEERCSPASERFANGIAFFHDGLPLVHSLNFLRLQPSSGPLPTAEELASAADRLLGGRKLKHRRITVMDENAGTELEAGFDRLGWTVERLLVMAHHRPMYETSDDVPAREYTEDEIKPHRQAYVANEPFGERAPPPSVVTEQLMRRRDVIGAATTSRAFGAEVDGEVVSFADMYSDGRTAQIEDVGTRNTHLRKGLSRAVMKVAIEAAAGHEFLFLVADDRDWPKDFYARLGFDPIGITYEFFRPIAGSAAPSDPS